MRYQGETIAKLLPQPECGPILDAACGIGTQSLALAALGYSVEGSDISSAEVARAFFKAVLGASRTPSPSRQDIRTSFIRQDCSRASTPRKQAKKMLAQLFKRLYFGSLTN
jgi:SAM-dependent methyltransferase